MVMTMMKGGPVMPVVIKDRHRDTVIDGELACDPVSNERDTHVRWVELEVYRLASGDWLVHRASCSVIYHRPGTPCTARKGRQAGLVVDSISELPADAEPCRYCNPLPPGDLPDDGGGVRYEFTRHSYYQSASREDLVASLARLKKQGQMRGVVLFDPIDELMANLIHADPAFAELGRPVDRYA